MLTMATYCMAATLLFEAGGEGVTSQRAVMSVVRNRGDNPCQVIKEDRQFSFVKHGKIPKIKDYKTFLKMQKIVLTEKPNLSKRYRYFNHKSLGVRYKTGVKPVRIASMIFY